MTNLMYHRDSRVQQFDAEVTAVDAENGGVILSQTAFYPGGGGQPADFGILTRADGTVHEVKRAKMIKGQIVHLIDGEDLPAVGEQVRGKINWEHRYQLMRTHTAMHILCGVIWRDYEKQVTGGNMEPLKGRMDFEFEDFRGELVSAIEAAINAEVEAARDVKVNVLPREEAFQIPDLIRTKINLLPEHITEIRTIELVGLDLQADGGTHVQNTSEVGPIRITDYKSKGKINKRIYLELEP